MFIIHFGEIQIEIYEIKFWNIFWSSCSCDISIATMDFECLLSCLDKFKFLYKKLKFRNIFWSFCLCDVNIAITDKVFLLSILEKFKMIYMK